MVKFVELTGEYTYKWEFPDTDWHEGIGWGSDVNYKTTKYNTCSLTGAELIDWLQKYGLEPDKMFNGESITMVPHGKSCAKVNKYDLYKEAENRADNTRVSLHKKPWVVVGMNGGYVILSDSGTENTVELGNASAPANVNINNSNTVRNVNKNDTKVSIVKNSLF